METDVESLGRDYWGMEQEDTDSEPTAAMVVVQPVEQITEPTVATEPVEQVMDVHLLADRHADQEFVPGS